MLRSFHILSSSLKAADALPIRLFSSLVLSHPPAFAESSKVFKVIHRLDNALITKGGNRIGDTGSSDRCNFGLLIAHLESEFPEYYGWLQLFFAISASVSSKRAISSA